MFEISILKTKKLSELQEIAENLKISKFKTLKKLDLVYKILDHQASNPDTKKPVESVDKVKSNFKSNIKPQKENKFENSKKYCIEKNANENRQRYFVYNFFLVLEINGSNIFVQSDSFFIYKTNLLCYLFFSYNSLLTCCIISLVAY